MKVDFRIDDQRSRLVVTPELEAFDGDPGLDEIFFDGINEPISTEALAVVSWVLLSGFVSRRFAWRKPVARPLVNEMVRQWGSALEMGPAEESPKPFPERAGSLIIGIADDDTAANFRDAAAPVYYLRPTSLAASGTIFEGGDIRAKSNARILGNGLVTEEFPVLIATGLVFADFLGISDLCVSRDRIDAFAPRKVARESDSVPGWRELLKHAGFNLRVEG